MTSNAGLSFAVGIGAAFAGPLGSATTTGARTATAPGGLAPSGTASAAAGAAAASGPIMSTGVADSVSLAAAASFGMLSYPSHSVLFLDCGISHVCIDIVDEGGLRNVAIWRTL